MQLAVRLLPGVQRFALLEIEEGVHTQVLRHVALVVAKSAPVGTPMRGHPSLRSLAPPLPNRPTALGSVGDPRSWATQKAGTYHSGPLRFLRLFEVEESVHTQILRHVAQLLLDAEQLIVLGHAVGAAGSAGLNLAGVDGHGANGWL